MNPQRFTISSLLTALVVLVLCLSVCEAATAAKKRPLYENHKNLCRGQPKLSKKHENDLQKFVKEIGESKVVGQTPQNEAVCWMLRQGRSYEAQRYSLAVTYYSSKGAQWDTNTNWMTPKHECSWYGVMCNAFRAVVELDLGYIELEGLVPREMALLTSLRDLDLHGNDLQGVIPHRMMIGLKRIEYLRLQMNGLFGSIHKEVARMKNLKELYLFGNFFAGTIPKQISELKKLEIIDLYANQLEGTIPKELAKLPKLKYLDLHDNNLTGRMPKEICDLKLETLIADCHGSNPEVRCDCCTVCCEGLPVLACFDPKTGQQVSRAL
mmetsp:Transcript_6169/g.12736  ORF Transcript_6169/g.12736 Transcript_6169/m.12736 type:complete len:324 (+) Transcript_6169:77-1048(+)